MTRKIQQDQTASEQDRESELQKYIKISPFYFILFYFFIFRKIGYFKPDNYS